MCAGAARFIPTPVGNTRYLGLNQKPTAVHPHARGEHILVTPARGMEHGSSPRPWGTLGFGAVERLVTRFIPTPVGNTLHKYKY